MSLLKSAGDQTHYFFIYTFAAETKTFEPYGVKVNRRNKMNINEKKLEAVEFVKKNFNKMSTGEYGESILPIANGVVLYISWDGDDFNIRVYDHQHSIFVASGCIRDDVNMVIPCVDAAIENFYTLYISDCVKEHKPIALPGCDILYWDKRKKEYYYNIFRKPDWRKRWVDVWEYVESKDNNSFWLGE